MITKKKFNIIKWIAGVGILAVMFIVFTQGMSEEMPAEEKVFLDEVLSQITQHSTRTDVTNILGEPSRDMGLKVNWIVTIEGNEDRIGVYFSPTTGKATRINFDGGPGRFYYRRDFE
ncbi:MAG: hypothetical protein K0R93_676 [Anaerosolibacter sp.]|jgi:hypothetical protein|uniref:hypothetical protein n=1 Tax=Anaerosolibacter sp. TaxID=1872527 RepID=UPI00260F2A08|nr:hypothetical protein [Anaerosolibacter sp.]MDF2545778.1 hypothetical protein [Anaerosolibacter sp.]